MLEELYSQAFWVGLLKIIGVNIVLSGDNAVVIALAARSLPQKQQKAAVLWGSGAAVVMRIILTIFAVALLTLPWLKLTGSLLLFWKRMEVSKPATTSSMKASKSATLMVRSRCASVIVRQGTFIESREPAYVTPAQPNSSCDWIVRHSTT